MGQITETKYDDLKNPCCMVVEDSPTIQNYYQSLFVKFAVTTIVAENGLVALEHLKELEKRNFKLDFMIVDIMMPKMDGVQFMTELRKFPFHADIPLYIASAICDREKAVNIIKDFHPAGYLIKPIETNKLLEILKRFLKKPLS